MDTNGKIVVKNVSGADNINKEFALVESKTLDDQEKLVEEIIKLMKYLHSIEINIINHYTPLKNLKDIHHSQYNEYVNYMRSQILHMEEITKNINHKIDILEKSVENLNKIIDTHEDTIKSNIRRLLDHIDSEKDRIDNSLEKLREDMSKINEASPNDITTKYIEKISELKRNTFDTLITYRSQYYDELRVIKEDFSALVGI